MATKSDSLQGYLLELSGVLYESGEDTQGMREAADELGSDNYELFRKRFAGVLQALVSADMDFNQLNAYLTSQRNKRQNAITAAEAQSIESFWKTNKSRIHDIIASNTQWGSKLKSISWRVDVKSRSKSVDQLTDPIGIVQLKLGKSDPTVTDECIEFEVDENLGTELIGKLSKIEKKIKDYAEGK